MTKEHLWQAVLGELELVISRANFTTWFKNTFVIEVDDGRVIIGVPNTFTKTWLEKKYHDAIVVAIQNTLQETLREVMYKVEVHRPDGVFEHTTTAAVEPKAVAVSQAQQRFGLNERYRIESFIVGKGNELAHAAALAVASNPGKSYNPLFIYGGVGLGKTHLLQGVGLNLIEKGARVLYVTSERFTNDYIQSVRAGRAKEFKDQYRSVDVLLIDDIQFIAGKEATQEEFFHTFNALHQNNKQIVLTSDRPPKAIPALEQRLLSRFEWGMIADIANPDLETRTAILQSKCKEKRVNIDGDILGYLASVVQHNVRELEGALNRVLAEQEFSGRIATLDDVKKLYRDIAQTTTRTERLTPKQLIDIVCRYYAISIEDVLGKSRKRELVLPRQVSMYLMREETKASFPSIGQHVGQRDHTTVMHAYDKIKTAVENDEKIRQDILTIRQQLYVV
ncbi:MAG: chromosomal replication initiator protein DnaA [Patescibacteria group bacterium]|jgi:chromosomal replication initiator protein